MLNLSDLQPERLRPLSRKEYDRLVELGAFDEDEHVELLCGMLVAMSPQAPPHAAIIGVLNMALAPALVGRASVRVQLPLAISDDSEPEPDLAVVSPKSHWRAHPKRAWLVVEVADSSARKDRHIKAALYARGGVTEYWVVDVGKRVVAVYRRPSSRGYRQVSEHRSGEIRLAQFPDVAVEVSKLFG